MKEKKCGKACITNKEGHILCFQLSCQNGGSVRVGLNEKGIVLKRTEDGAVHEAFVHFMSIEKYVRREADGVWLRILDTETEKKVGIHADGRMLTIARSRDEITLGLVSDPEAAPSTGPAEGATYIDISLGEKKTLRVAEECLEVRADILQRQG